MREIPVEIVQDVRDKLPYNLEHITDLTGVNITRSILRKSKLAKYIENAHSIWAMASNRQPPYIKKLVEDRLLRYFKATVQVYEPLKGNKRNSFLNYYYYVLYKLFELLDETQYLPEIPMLKDREKLIEQDTIWKKICEELDWEFIATI